MICNTRLIAGLDEAIVGYVDQLDGARSVIYDHERMISTLMIKDGISREDAIEHISFNILGTLGDPNEGWPQILYPACLEDIMAWEDD